MWSFLARLRERKLAHWAVAYLAGAWLLLQVLSLLAQPFAWPDLVLRAATVLLGTGFIAVLVLAWYHGEKGAQRVSGVELLMLTGILVIAGAAVAFVARVRPGSQRVVAAEEQAATPPAAQGSIAVLPFANMSGDPYQEFFSDGLADELISLLDRVPDLRVAPRTSAFYFKGKNLPVDSVGRLLGVAWVVEGSVKTSGDRLRVKARLIDVATRQTLWDKSYDRTRSEALALEDALAREIAQALSLRFGPSSTRSTSSPAAFEHYLRGQYLLQTGWSTSLREAIEEYLAATAADPDYAAAYAALGTAYQYLAFFGLEPHRKIFPAADAATRRALALDSTSAEAHAALGQLERWWRHDRSAAEQELVRALELDPDNVRAHEVYAWFLADTRQFDSSLRHAQRMMELNPFSPRHHALYVELLVCAGRYDRALAQADSLLVIDTTFAGGWIVKAEALLALGRAAEAATLLEQHADGLNTYAMGLLGQAYGMSGLTEQARVSADRLQQRAQREWIHPGIIATVYAGLKDVQQTLGWLEKAEQLSAVWPELDVWPTFSFLHGEPRYQQLVRNLGIAANGQ